MNDKNDIYMVNNESVYNTIYLVYKKYIVNPIYVYTSNNEWIIIMKLLEDTQTNTDRKDIINGINALYYADKLEVVLIFNKFNITKTCDILNDDKFTYTVGKIVQTHNYVQFFKSIMRAYDFNIHKNNNYTGESLIYNDNGLLIYKCVYKNGELKISYSYSNNKIYSKCLHIDNNIKSGIVEFYDCYEKIKTKCKFINGKYEGEHIQYHSNGKIQSTCFYINDNKCGEYVEYDIYGEKICECNYVDDKLCGEYIQFNKGDVCFKCIYNNGILDGKIITYYNDEIVLL